MIHIYQIEKVAWIYFEGKINEILIASIVNDVCILAPKVSIFRFEWIVVYVGGNCFIILSYVAKSDFSKNIFLIYPSIHYQKYI